MSLQGLLKEIDRKKSEELLEQIRILREQHASDLQSKEKEIACLREEIDTLRNWLDHSALPAFNPISKRKEAMGLVKMNFSPDKPCPDMWSPGEKELLESIESDPRLSSEPVQEPPVPEDQEEKRPDMETPLFEPPSHDLSRMEKPEPPSMESQELEEPKPPEFSTPDLEVSEPEPRPVSKKDEGITLEIDGNGSEDVPIPNPFPKKSAARKPRASRKTSFPSLKKATKNRKKA